MLYAMNKWRKMILICLWLYAMRHANNVANVMPKKGENSSPLEKFSGVKVAPKLRHFHSFGCPTYVLDNALQSGKAHPNGDNAPGSGCTLGHHPTTRGQWPWCSTLAQVTCCHNFTSSSMIFLRLCSRSLPTWTPRTLSGNS